MEARQVVSADAGSARYLHRSPRSWHWSLALRNRMRPSSMERRARQLKIETAFFDAAALEARRHAGAGRCWIAI